MKSDIAVLFLAIGIFLFETKPLKLNLILFIRLINVRKHSLKI